jgi:hypothetical protein
MELEWSPMPIMAICSPGRREAGPAALPAWPSLFRRLHPLTKLLNLRSQLDELENPSAQNSRTVENLAADTHWPILEHNRERKRRREPRMSLPKHAMADREIIGEDYFFLCLE